MNFDTRLEAFEGTDIEKNSRDFSKLRAIKMARETGDLTEGSPLENELVTLESKYLANTELAILRSLVPQANIENITFETARSADTRRTLVKIVYSISDVVEADAISQWFDQQEYEKYFRVNAKLCLYDADLGISTEIKSQESPALSSSGATSGELLNQDTDSNVTKFTFEKVYSLSQELYGMDFEITTSFDIKQLEDDYDVDFGYDNSDTEIKKKIVILEKEKFQYPVQDFRIREEFKGFKLDDGRRKDFEYLLQDVSKIRKINRDNSSDFLSDFWLTRNAQGEAKFLFVFDLESFYEKKSQYKEFYKRMNLEERKTVRNSIHIPSLKIRRKRVKVLQDKNGRSVIDFKDQYTLEDIVETRKYKNSSSFKKVVKDKGSIMQIDISGISDGDLMFLTGTDYQMAKITDGAYAYGVSLEVVDTLRQILIKKISNFGEKINLVKRLHSNSIRPENYDATTNLYKKTIEEMSEEDFSSLHYFVREMYNLFVTDEVRRGRRRGRIRRRQRRSTIARRIESLFDMKNIKSPTELEMLIEIMETQMRNAASSIGEPSSRFVGKKNVSVSNPVIKIEKFYTSPEFVFDSTIPKRHGIDYLSNVSESDLNDVMKEIMTLSQENSNVGLRVIDGAQWESRVTEEISKFFQAGTTSVNLPQLGGPAENNNISLTSTGSEFLTMSVFTAGLEREPEIFLGNQNQETQNKNILTANIISATKFPPIPGIPKSLPYEDREEALFLSKYGVTFENEVDKLSILNNDLGSRNSSDSDSSPNQQVEVDFLEEMNENIEQRDFEKFVFSKMIEPLSSPRLGMMDIFVTEIQAISPVIRNENLGISVSKRAEYEAAPNQIIAQIQPNISIDTGRTATVTEGFLTKIEYLSAFDSDTEFRNVNKPVWSSLTLDAYRANASKNLICRIKPYQNEKLGIRTTGTNTPIYDSFFVIRPVSNFTYEYRERVQIENEDAIKVIKNMVKSDIQELVYNEWIARKTARYYSERYMAESIDPRLAIANRRENYTETKWLEYNGRKRRIERSLRERGYTGYELENQTKLETLMQAELLINKPTGLSPAWEMQIIKMDTEDLHNRILENVDRTTEAYGARQSKIVEAQRDGFIVLLSGASKNSSGIYIITPESESHPIVDILTSAEASGEYTASVVEGVQDTVERALNNIRRGY